MSDDSSQWKDMKREKYRNHEKAIINVKTVHRKTVVYIYTVKT